MADMGKEDELNSAVGWDGPNNRSMTHAQVQAILNHKRAKGRIILANGDISYKRKVKEVEWRRGAPIATNIVVREFLSPQSHWVSARKDQFEPEKAQAVLNYGVEMQTAAREAQEMQRRSGLSEKQISVFIPYDFNWKHDVQRFTWTYNLGSMEMVSKFEDEHPILPELGTGPDEAIDGDANYYSAKTTFLKSNLLPSGLWGEYEKKTLYFSFKSWETHHLGTDEFCKENERITDPQVYDGITRYVANRNKLEYQIRLTPSLYGPIRTGSWRIVGAESVVVHDPRATKPR